MPTPRPQGQAPRLPGAWPRLCELCRAWSQRSLCGDCLARFAPLRPRCEHCALPTGVALARCGECLRMPPPWERCSTLGDYTYPWDGLIAGFKFQGRVDLAGPLSQALAETLSRNPKPLADLVLPVPLSTARLAERGYNQAWELARRTAGHLGLRADAHTLLRLRDTAHQVGLGRDARTDNLRQAFWVEPTRQAAVRGLRVALVDDVLTTGATAAAATQALLQAGAASVQVWVLARTPASPA